MKDIINIEDRLHIIKQLFELQIKIGADVGFIHLCTEKQNWDPNSFRAECIAANLSDIKQFKTLENILNLSKEVVNIYYKLPKPKKINWDDEDFMDDEIEYRLECTPFEQRFHNLTLTKKEKGKRYFYQEANNYWELMPPAYWKKYPIKHTSYEEWRKRISDNKHGLISNDMLIIFVSRIKSFLEERVLITPHPDSENDDKNKSTKGKNMNLDLLDILFIPLMTKGAYPTKLDQLKEDLRVNVCSYKKKQITALADVIFKSEMLHRNTKQKEFTKWLTQFCLIIDYPQPTYKQNQVKNEYDTLKKTYYYLFP